jgi:hypothetical protein
MRSNERLQRILEMRQLGGMEPAAACPVVGPASSNFSDLRLFALTFAAGFLFTSIFIA